MERCERMQHMVEEERLLLLDLISEKKNILLSRATDARIIPRKARTWEEVTNSLAVAAFGPQRTVKQVKKIWENMKSRAKKFVSDKKKNLCRTGGGPPSPDTKLDPVLGKILALIADELEPDPNPNDSDSWPRDVNLYFNGMGELISEPATEHSSIMKISHMPAGNDSTPLPSTSVEAPGTVASARFSNTPLPSTSVLALLPVSAENQLPPMQSSSTPRKVSGKKCTAKKRKMEDSAARESYEILSKFQREEHEIVMEIHKENLQNKKMEGEYLRQKMKIVSNLYSKARDTMEDVRAAAAASIDFMDNFRTELE